MKNKINYLMLFKGMVSLFRNAEDTDSVFTISDSLRNSNATKLALEFMKEDESLQALIGERYLGPDWKLDELKTYPPGSMGQSLYQFLNSHQFTPDTFRKPSVVSDDIDYLEFRLRKTHDAWHVLGNFGTDVTGELGIQAFRFGQTRLPLSIILIGGGLIQILRNSPRDLATAFNEIARGWMLGSKARPLLPLKFEELWHLPLAELRDRLGIKSEFVQLS